jgi:hypothetical protein
MPFAGRDGHEKIFRDSDREHRQLSRAFGESAASHDAYHAICTRGDTVMVNIYPLVGTTQLDSYLLA